MHQADFPWSRGTHSRFRTWTWKGRSETCPMWENLNVMKQKEPGSILLREKGTPEDKCLQGVQGDEETDFFGAREEVLTSWVYFLGSLVLRINK